MKTTCPFCDELHPQILLLNPTVKAMYPKSPVCRYHVLIMPNRHVRHIDQMKLIEWDGIRIALSKLLRSVRTENGFIGYNLLSNNGDHRVNQRVNHAHLHVFLRFENDTEDPIRARSTEEARDLTDAQLNNFRILKNLLNRG